MRMPLVSSLPGTTGYDLVRGNLGALVSSGGDYFLATDTCLVNGLLMNSIPDTDQPMSPGEGFWYLTRTRDPIGSGTYDSGYSSQVGLRSEEIDLSGSGCL